MSIDECYTRCLRNCSIVNWFYPINSLLSSFTFECVFFCKTYLIRFRWKAETTHDHCRMKSKSGRKEGGLALFATWTQKLRPTMLKGLQLQTCSRRSTPSTTKTTNKANNANNNGENINESYKIQITVAVKRGARFVKVRQRQKERIKGGTN